MKLRKTITILSFLFLTASCDIILDRNSSSNTSSTTTSSNKSEETTSNTASTTTSSSTTANTTSSSSSTTTSSSTTPTTSISSNSSYIVYGEVPSGYTIYDTQSAISYMNSSEWQEFEVFGVRSTIIEVTYYNTKYNSYSLELENGFEIYSCQLDDAITLTPKEGHEVVVIGESKIYNKNGKDIYELAYDNNRKNSPVLYQLITKKGSMSSSSSSSSSISSSSTSIKPSTSSSSSSVKPSTSNSNKTSSNSSFYSGLSGNALKLKLRNENQAAHKKNTSYSGLRDCYEDFGEKYYNGKIRGFYSHAMIDCTWNGSTYNREHVWPKSKSWFYESGAGSDFHHLRPTFSRINSTRSSLPFGNLDDSTAKKASETYNGTTYIGGYYSNSYFEPLDHSKGDCARIVFYLLTRYSEADNYKITNVAQSIELLLEWNELDPVDEYEMQRNDYGESVQGNRNPFIDNPEYARLIWG